MIIFVAVRSINRIDRNTSSLNNPKSVRQLFFILKPLQIFDLKGFIIIFQPEEFLFPRALFYISEAEH